MNIFESTINKIKSSFKWSEYKTFYTLEDDVNYQTSIRDIELETEWGNLDFDGLLTIKKGYSWNGCSPKIEVYDMIIGTPEGIKDDSGLSKTYLASLVHDWFYQYSKDVELMGVTRLDIDSEFYHILKQVNFKSAYLYYALVRLLGWTAWSDKRPSN